MKQFIGITTSVLLLLCVFLLAGCSDSADPGTPPAEIVGSTGDNAEASDSSTEGYDGSTISAATTVMVGQSGGNEYNVDMPNNAAVHTMLGYLSSSDLLFPTYTYDEKVGYVAQNIRGTYTQDDEVIVEDIKCGELYLFSDGQLRLYFKDIKGANITATPVGTLTSADDLAQSVTDAYESNIGDTWGVSVYFRIKKNVD